MKQEEEEKKKMKKKKKKKKNKKRRIRIRWRNGHILQLVKNLQSGAVHLNNCWDI